MIPDGKQKPANENEEASVLFNERKILPDEKLSGAYLLTPNEVALSLQTSLQDGLTPKQINERHIAFGYNRLTAKKEKTLLQILLQQFTGVAVYLLWAAASISFILNDTAEAIAIVIVLLLNAAIGFVMEWQAVSSLKALKELDITKAKVISNGKLEEIASQEITVGDLLYVEAGDIIPADARVISSTHLQTEESALTGESLPVTKQHEALTGKVVVAERNNMLYKGTSAINGSAKAIVTAIGNNTELGKISMLVQQAKPDATPLEKQLQSLSKNLVWITLIIAVAVYVLGITKGNNYFLMLETAIAMAVAAIPEGLPIVATITLAKGMLRMSKKNVIIKKLPSVETLGKTDVILTDKTGTLTHNRIRAEIVITSTKDYNIPIITLYERKDKHALYWLHVIAALCNNASIHENKKIGDPLEIALLEWINESYASKKIIKKYTKIDEEPFNAQTKSMAALHTIRHHYLVTAKGAAENILNYCTHELSGNQLYNLTNKNKSAWLKKNEKLSAQGYRVLAFAFKRFAEKPGDNLMKDLIFVGLIAFSDPPRQNIIHAIETCKKAGIKTVMLTGDHPSTALHIAQQLKLTSDHYVISGNDISTINELNSKEKNKILNTAVFARVTPEQKLDIVSLYQQEGHIVAMTGDGINDAPALKKADVGIAMGERGTQIAKDAADIILTDDSFNSIETAIEEGRIIFENIQKSVIYLLSCNLSEVLIIAAVTFIYFTSPLTPLQILYMNLITDVLPALALGMSKGSAGIMQKPPYKKQHNIILAKHWKAISIYSFVITICIFCSYAYCTGYLNFNKQVADNILFWSLALAQLWHSFNLSYRYSSFFKNEIFRNKYVWFALIICIAIVIATYSIAAVRNVLMLVPLNLYQIIIIFITSIIPVLIIQFFKKLKLVI
jgi:Ca2+-transporting ATPase